MLPAFRPEPEIVGMRNEAFKPKQKGGGRSPLLFRAGRLGMFLYLYWSFFDFVSIRDLFGRDDRETLFPALGGRFRARGGGFGGGGPGGPRTL